MRQMKKWKLTKDDGKYSIVCGVCKRTLHTWEVTNYDIKDDVRVGISKECCLTFE